jgi:hypothetical protein
MVSHHLRGSPWQHPLEDDIEEGVGNITYPWGKEPLLYNQIVSHPHPMPMDTLNTLLQTRPRCAMGVWVGESRILLHVGLRMANNRHMPHGWGKLGTTTRQAWWQINVSRSCRSTITIWHITLRWCLNEFYVLRAYVVELWYLFMLLQACV